MIIFSYLAAVKGTTEGPSLFTFLPPPPFSFCSWVLTNRLENIKGVSNCLIADISLLYKGVTEGPSQTLLHPPTLQLL